jgi:hypothetical protein
LSESTSKKSKGGSGTSPATGAATDGRGRSGRHAGDSVLDIELADGRWGHFGWAGFGLVIGGVLVIGLGPVGTIIGLLVLLMAASSGAKFARAMRRPAGHIRVDAREALLPRGLNSADSEHVSIADLRHAYFLRRSVPLNRAAPLLVIETAAEAFTYPRDWFSSDSDQRRVAMAINRRLEQR